jgi:methyl-accepting chemotaxis protein
MLTCVIGISFLILSQASRLQLEAAMENAEHITKEGAQDISQHYASYLDTVRVLIQILNKYETIDAPLRRILFDENLYSVLEANPSYTGIFTVWKPNALDGMDEQYAGTAGTDRSGQYIPWYTRTAKGIELRPYPRYKELLANAVRHETLSDPDQASSEDEDTLLVTVTAPITSSTGDILGLVGIIINISALQTIVEGIRPYETGVAGVFSNNGVIAGHFVPAKRGAYMRDTEQALLGDHLATVITSIREGKDVTLRTYSAALGTEVYLIYRPIEIGETGTPWSIMVAIPINKVLAPIYSLVLYTLLIVAIASVIASFVLFYVVLRITKPIISMSLMLKDISEGEGDLTKELLVGSKDEIGDMAHYFNLTLEKIKHLVIKIKEKSGTLLNVGNELSVNMIETSSSINAITSHIQNIRNQVVGQSASITQTNSTIGLIINNIDKLNEFIENQAANVTQSSSAIEEMLANIKSVTQTLGDNSGNVKNLAEASKVGRTSLNGMAEDIQTVEKESEGLLKINSVIKDVAVQINLLSMNAAIEAAHAGEAGKGFAVVSDEIRKLAESSGSQSKSISAVLQKMKDSIDKITLSAQEVLLKFEAIDSGVRIVSNQEESILQAMEEQNVGSQQILESMARLNEITQRVRNGSLEMMRASKEIIDETENVGNAAQELSNGIHEVATGADQINVTVNRVQTISQENKENIDTLAQEVSLFKVE